MNRILASFAAFVFIWVSCQPDIPYQSIQGVTMGTTYSIVYQSDKDIRGLVDSLLLEINSEVSTYIPTSDISKFNEARGSFSIRKEAVHFRTNWQKSKEITEATNGYFDPTVMPLINYWGFGYQEKIAQATPDSTKVDSLMEFVGIDKIQEKGQTLNKKHPGVELDFSAVAKGYAVDEVSDLLSQLRIKNFLVEIGGETVTRGKNSQGNKWRLGVNTPKEDAGLMDFELILEISEHGLASSGNYRNFYVVDNKKYGHTIDPKTGYPSLNELLGATVIADDCITADAYATAFMAMGLEKALTLSSQINDLEACFFTSDDLGNIKKSYTNGFVQYIGQQ